MGGEAQGGGSRAAPRPLEALSGAGDARSDALRRLIAVVDRLRAPDGCPWDREQTLETMAPSLIEEAHELLEAIERGDAPGSVEEAGDLLMVIVLVCRIAEDQGRFDLAQVGEGVVAKLVRRHPHVFGDATVGSAAHVVANWERIKEGERREKRTDSSALAGVPVALPALQRAHRMGEKAISAGFRWTGAPGALAKVREELAELEAVLDVRPADLDGARRARAEEELGDLLLATALLGNYLGIDPERAAREALRRFERRFRSMEQSVGGSVRGVPLERLVAAWGVAKAGEAGPATGATDPEVRPDP